MGSRLPWAFIELGGLMLLRSCSAGVRPMAAASERLAGTGQRQRGTQHAFTHDPPNGDPWVWYGKLVVGPRTGAGGFEPPTS